MTQREQQLIFDVHRLQAEVARLRLSDNSKHGPTSPIALELEAVKGENIDLKSANDTLTSKLRSADTQSDRLKANISRLSSECDELRERLKSANQRPVKTVEKDRVVHVQPPETIALISELKARVSLLERELSARGDD